MTWMETPSGRGCRCSRARCATRRRSLPSTYSRARKGVSSWFPSSNTWAMLPWLSLTSTRASLVKRSTNSGSCASCGSMRLITQSFWKSRDSPSCARNSSPIPPWARRATSVYRPNRTGENGRRRCCAGCVMAPGAVTGAPLNQRRSPLTTGCGSAGAPRVGEVLFQDLEDGGPGVPQLALAEGLDLEGHPHPAQGFSIQQDRPGCPPLEQQIGQASRRPQDHQLGTVHGAQLAQPGLPGGDDRPQGAALRGRTLKGDLIPGAAQLQSTAHRPDGLADTVPIMPREHGAEPLPVAALDQASVLAHGTEEVDVQRMEDLSRRTIFQPLQRRAE